MTRVALSFLVAALAALHAVTAASQAYPNRPIRVIVPAAAGDSCDILTRLIGFKVGEHLGQQLAAEALAQGAQELLGKL